MKEAIIDKENYTKYEKARMIGARALQLAMGAPLLLKLSKETGCGICVDFAHLKARNIGKIDYDEVMKKIKDVKYLTCHFSGIVWGAKGERHHELTKEKDLVELFTYLKKYKINTRIINESPDVFGDTLKSMKIWEKMK